MYIYICVCVCVYVYMYVCMYINIYMGFPDSSAGKESICNAGDPGSISGLGRSPGEGIGYPLQYCLASLVAQLVNNLPEIWETRVWSLGWEDPLKEGMTTHCSILAWRIPIDRVAWQAMGLQKVRHDWVTKHTHSHIHTHVLYISRQALRIWIIKRWVLPGKTSSIMEGRDAWLQYMRMSCPWKCWGGNIIYRMSNYLADGCEWRFINKEIT